MADTDQAPAACVWCGATGAVLLRGVCVWRKPCDVVIRQRIDAARQARKLGREIARRRRLYPSRRYPRRPADD